MGEISGGASRPRGMASLPTLLALKNLLIFMSSVVSPPCLYAKPTLFINYSTFLTEAASAQEYFSAATTALGSYEGPAGNLEQLIQPCSASPLTLSPLGHLSSLVLFPPCPSVVPVPPPSSSLIFTLCYFPW